MLQKMLCALVYGDLLMDLTNQVRPYEVTSGTADQLCQHWIDDLSRQFNRRQGLSIGDMKRNMRDIVMSYAASLVKSILNIRRWATTAWRSSWQSSNVR